MEPFQQRRPVVDGSISEVHQRIFITHVDAFGPYLRIYGQQNEAAMDALRSHIVLSLPTFSAIDPTWSVKRQMEFLQPGDICLYKRLNSLVTPNDWEFLRASILRLSVQSATVQVEVEFIDYGNKGTLASFELLVPKTSGIWYSAPPLCSQYIVLGIHHDWTKVELDEISRMILYKKTDIFIKNEINKTSFITMIWKDFNFAEFLILQKQMGAPIANNLLFSYFFNYFKDQISICGTNDGVRKNNNNYNMPNNNSIISPSGIASIPQTVVGHPRTELPVAVSKNEGANTVQSRLQRYQPYQNEDADSSKIINNSNRNIPNYNFSTSHQVSVQQYNNSSNKTEQKFNLSNREQHNNMDSVSESDSIINNMISTKINRAANATFRSTNLKIGNYFDVHVSFVENGPCLFTVQLDSIKEQLTDMMTSIEHIKLKPLTGKILVGSACIARYSEDGHLYRALIISVKSNACKVTYVDYGNTEFVKFENLFEITEEFLALNAFAVRFALSGLSKLGVIDECLKKQFQEMVMYKPCRLKVVPCDGLPMAQYCELFYQKQNVLGVLQEIQTRRLVYIPAEHLIDNNIVEIRFINSPSDFFVQNLANMPAFEKLMDEMKIYYNKNQFVPKNISKGDPCVVKHDTEWYRSEVIRSDGIEVTVRYIDFGFEQKVPKHLLSTISENHVKMPRQAVQCCLKGFEGNDCFAINQTVASTTFEMLCEDSDKRRSFSVKLFRIQPDGVNIINLLTKEFNVMKKLFKLSMPFEKYLIFEKEQCSPRPHHYERKTPSVISSSDSVSISSAKSSNILSSTKLEPETSLNQMSAHEKRTSSHKTPTSGTASDNSERRKNKQKEISQKGKFGRQGPKMSFVNDQLSPSNAGNIKSRILEPIQNHNTVNKESTRRQNKQQIPEKGRQQNSLQDYFEEHPSSLNSNSSKHKEANAPITNNLNERPGNDSFMSLEYNYINQTIEIPSREQVVVSWWISPYQFYIQLKSRNIDFETMNNDMQLFYKDMPWQQLRLKIGSAVVIRLRTENTFYRGRILACKHMIRKYNVQLIDFGNQLAVPADDIWQLHQRFAHFPTMAYKCTLKGIISNYDHNFIIEQMEKYLPRNTPLFCDFISREGEIFIVDITVNCESLKERLINDGILQEISSDFQMDLLAGQQAQVKITAIKDMLNFKIHFEVCCSQIKFLASYKDALFVKSNPNVAKKFKSFYDNKSCVVNIKELNDNKVLLLSPLVPLLKEETVLYICSYPIFFKTYDIRIVFISSPFRLYGQLIEKEIEISSLLDEMYNHYQNAAIPPLKYIEVGQVCAAQAIDENWYRSRIVSVSKNSHEPVEVFYIDYGNIEKVDRSLIKELDVKFYANKTSYGIEINLPMRANSLEQQHKNDSITKILEENSIEKVLTMKPIAIYRNRPISDLFVDGNVNILDILKSKKLIYDRDVDYLRNLLDQEKPNMNEYIDMVDLTSDDENDNEISKKFTTPKKQKHAKENIDPPVLIKSTDLLLNTNEMMTNLTVKNDEDLIPKNLIESDTTDTSSRNQTLVGVPVNNHAKDIHVETAHESVVSKSSSPLLMTTSELPTVNLYENMEHAVLSHCDNPAQFFIHLSEKIDDLHKFQEDLQIIASSLPPLVSVFNGAQCISLYSVDKQWYRAKIMDAELMVLQFIDFGNTDCVSDATDIKVMDVVPDLEPFCIPCALPIKPHGTVDWVDAANAIFNESYSKNLYFEYITRGDYQKRSFVKLYIDGINVAEKLIKDGFAEPLEFVESSEKCFISHANSISEFWIQYEKDSKALELIEIYLSENQNLQKLENVEKGKIVAALFPDDQQWYRARCLKTLSNGCYEVIFIDYGNTSVSQELREICEEIAIIPPLSKKCALELPSNCNSWSDAAESKFFEIAALGETIFTIELREPASNHSIVHLLIDGHNIIHDLEQLCEKGNEQEALNDSFGNSTYQSSINENGAQHQVNLTQINTLKDFYIQFTKDSARLEDITSTLKSLSMNELNQPTVGHVCAAFCEFFEAIYRVKILEISESKKEYRVLCIDFGYAVSVNKLFMLPQDLQKIRAFAVHCQLQNASSFDQFGDLAIQIFKSINDSKDSYKMETVNCAMEPMLVTLYNSNNENINEEILCQLKKSEQSEEQPTMGLKPNTCIISHAFSPKNFYIQLTSNASKMEFVEKILQNIDKIKQPVLESASTGDTCVVFSDEDNRFYRGCLLGILDQMERKFNVQLIDYGNSIESQKLYKLPEELQDIEKLAIKCKLNLIPANIDEQKLKDIFNALLDKHFGEFYKIVRDEFDEEDNQHTVTLEINYKDLAEELEKSVSSGIGDIETSSVLPALEDCTVIHINSTESFYIQLMQDLSEIENITYILLDAETQLEILQDLQVGDICAAKFSEDEAFYRAKITAILGNGKYKVHYLDFGNDSIAENIRKLPKDLDNMRPYAKHCKLDFDFPTAEHTKLLNEYVENNLSETFQVEFLKKGPQVNICNLFCKQKDVMTLIKQQLILRQESESKYESVETDVTECVKTYGNLEKT